MAVSDLNLIRHLLQATQGAPEPLRWRRRGPGEFHATLNGVRLSLSLMQSESGFLRCLSLSNGAEKTRIEEPPNEAPFGSKYRGEEDQLLAESLQLLMESVAEQCAPKRSSAWDLRDSIREALFNRVLFGKP